MTSAASTCKIAFCSLLVCFPLISAKSQTLHVNEKEIEPLIAEWNYANNSRSVESFYNVYGDRLLFYTEDVSASKAVELKKKLFVSKPDFRQRLVPPVTYTPFTTGVIKCDLTKEVWEKNRWKAYDSYLLVSYEQNRYWIVGESDYDTDKVLDYRLNIGEPMLLASDSLHHGGTDSTTAAKHNIDSSAIYRPKPRGLAAIANYVASDEVISVPRNRVFMLLGALLTGGLMIFVADMLQRERQRKTKRSGYPDEKEKSSQDSKLQSQFRNFVITLFDPLYFKVRKINSEPVTAGNIREDSLGADLDLEFKRSEARAHFEVRCIYRASTFKGAMTLSLHDGKQRQIEINGGRNIYYILGIDGKPDDPKHFYLLPANAVRNEGVTMEMLEPYRKSGMFFYHEHSGRLL